MEKLCALNIFINNQIIEVVLVIIVTKIKKLIIILEKNFKNMVFKNTQDKNKLKKWEKKKKFWNWK